MRKGNWEGTWYCAWINPDEASNWIVDEIELIQNFGRLKIRLLKPGSKYTWTGMGVLRTPYFIGEWKSLRPHSHSQGTFTFWLLPQGDQMLGYFVGPDDQGKLGSYEAILTSDKNIILRLQKARATDNDEIVSRQVMPPPVVSTAQVDLRPASIDR